MFPIAAAKQSAYFSFSVANFLKNCTKTHSIKVAAHKISTEYYIIRI